MRRITGFVLSLCLAFVPVLAAGADGAPPFEVQRLSDRVLVLKELSPWESNHVVIVGDSGLVLVDPGHSAVMGRLIREATARELGRDRFAYVIDTHGHWGHCWGNSAFPEATVIAHDNVREEMRADEANLERRAASMRGQAEQASARLAELDPASEEARTARQERDHLERIVAGLAEPGFAVQPPQLTFTDHLRLDLGDLSLDMAYLGRGHSDSDITILIPEEKVLLLGCFFLEQGPLPVFGIEPVLDPDRWLATFGSALDREPPIEHVVLGQHTVWSRQQLAELRDYIAWMWTGVQALDAEGVDLDTAVARLPLAGRLAGLQQAGIGEEDLARFHRTEVTTLWRQVKESAAAEIGRAVDQGGAAAGVARYRELVAANDPEVFFDEAELNLLGYRLLGQSRVDDAIAVFQLNVERFPNSWNVYDSLGEAYAVKGDRQRAVELYRRSLELNPDNTNGVQALERLGVGAKSSG
jgi:glyoxylase-like metal-dependent hydrolase (beta-lactamase superfamily II)